MDFNEYLFPGDVSFSGAQFGEGYVDFSAAQFGEGDVDFGQAQFGEGDVSFSQAQFGEGYVNFSQAQFGEGYVNFSQAQFGAGDVSFRDVQFGEGAILFDGSIFESGTLSFKHANFPGPMYFKNVVAGLEGGEEYPVTFEGSVFKSPLTLDSSRFNTVPDFRHTRIEQDITMEGTEVTYTSARVYRYFKAATSPDDTSRYRKLRELAIDAKDHDREHTFFAFEQRSKFHHHLNAFQYFPIFLYNIITDFGRSIWRPGCGLIFTWLLAAQLFYWRSFVDFCVTFGNALTLSAANMMPFLGWSNSARGRQIEQLYGDPPQIHWTVELVAFSEGSLSLLFIFLIGLALKNRTSIAI